MKASKTVTTIFAAATLVGAISLAYAQASADMQPAEPTQTEQQLQPGTDISPAPATDGSQPPVTQAQDASGTPAGTLAVPAETTSTMPAQTPVPAQAPVQAQTYDNNKLTTGNVPDNSAPLITERSPRADRN